MIFIRQTQIYIKKRVYIITDIDSLIYFGILFYYFFFALAQLSLRVTVLLKIKLSAVESLSRQK